MTKSTLGIDHNGIRELTAEQLNAIELLLSGMCDREVSERIGVDRTTVTRWRLYHPAVKAELNKRHQEIRGNATEKLLSLLPEAVEVITETIRDKNNPSRLKCAMDLIKTMKARDILFDLSAPMEADEIIRKEAERPLDVTLPADIEQSEDEIQARLQGMSYLDYIKTKETQKEG